MDILSPRLVDDDGTLLETPAEMAERHRSEHMQQLRALLEGNPFLPDARASGRPTTLEGGAR